MGQPRSLFAPKIRYLTVYAVLMILWMLTQMAIYAVLINNSRCGGLTKLLVFWLCSYIIGAIMPVFAMFVVKYNRYFRIVYAYLVLMILYKIAIPITLGVEAWTYIGSCYLTTALKVTVIVTNVLQALAYIVMMLLVHRASKVIREQNIQKLVTAKTFLA